MLITCVLPLACGSECLRLVVFFFVLKLSRENCGGEVREIAVEKEISGRRRNETQRCVVAEQRERYCSHFVCFNGGNSESNLLHVILGLFFHSHGK